MLVHKQAVEATKVLLILKNSYGFDSSNREEVIRCISDPNLDHFIILPETKILETHKLLPEILDAHLKKHPPQPQVGLLSKAVNFLLNKPKLFSNVSNSNETDNNNAEVKEQPKYIGLLPQLISDERVVVQRLCIAALTLRSVETTIQLDAFVIAAILDSIYKSIDYFPEVNTLQLSLDANLHADKGTNFSAQNYKDSVISQNHYLQAKFTDFLKLCKNNKFNKAATMLIANIDRWNNTGNIEYELDGYKEHVQRLVEHAVRYGHRECIEALLKVYVIIDSWTIDLNKTDEYGYTALYTSADRGDAEIVRLLVKHGADINFQGQCGDTPLHRASRKNHRECMTALNDAHQEEEKKTFTHRFTCSR